MTALLSKTQRILSIYHLLIYCEMENLIRLFIMMDEITDEDCDQRGL